MATRHESVGPVGRIVAANIRRLRKQQRLTQRDLARLISAKGVHMDNSTLWRIEEALSPVTADRLAALAGVLGVTAGQLMTAPDCDTCQGAPPAGFACNACGRGGTQ